MSTSPLKAFRPKIGVEHCLNCKFFEGYSRTCVLSKEAVKYPFDCMLNNTYVNSDWITDMTTPPVSGTVAWATTEKCTRVILLTYVGGRWHHYGAYGPSLVTVIAYLPIAVPNIYQEEK